GDSIRRIVRITESKYFLKPLSRTFHGRDIFAPVAAQLSRGVDLARFGPLLKGMTSLDVPAPRRSSSGTLQGEVVSIDRFGNLITNISARMLPVAPDVRIRVGRRILRALSRSSAAAPKG